VVQQVINFKSSPNKKCTSFASLKLLFFTYTNMFIDPYNLNSSLLWSFSRCILQ